MAKFIKHNLIILCFGVCILGLLCIFFVSPKKTTSMSERRKLATFPELTWENIQDKSFMEDLEAYLLDHFSFRDGLRKIKAFFAYDVLAQLENNDIYMAEGYAGKLEYPLKENSVIKAADKMQEIKALYFPHSEVYYAIVPDKNYFLAQKNGYPSMEYDRLKTFMQEQLTDMTYIHIWDTLTIEDYYKTDLHWKQENLFNVVNKIENSMNLNITKKSNYKQIDVGEFYGTYYGQLHRTP